MSEREVRIKFTGDSAVLKGAAGDVRKIFQNLVADENDARGAGEKMADAQKQVAAQMRKSMAEISEAADVLADSLGPEMVRAIEATGRTVEDEVQRFQKLGLTLDDVKRDSELLAAGMKDLDESARMSSGAVGDGMKKMATSADQSRSVMANLAGNAISEMPLVAGAIGPVNVALGQLAEYAVDGNIKLKNLAMMGGPMLGVGAAIALVSSHMEQVAKTNAFNRARVDAFTEALREGATAAEAWDAALTGEDKKIEFVDAATGDVQDLTDELYRNGITWAEFRSHLSDTREEFDAWVAANFAYKNGENDRNHAFQTGIQLMEKMAEAERQLTMDTFVYGNTAANATREVDRGSDSLVQNMDATASNALAQEALTTALERTEEAQRDLNAARLASIDTAYAVADAEDRFTQAMESLAAATDDPKTGVNELEQAQRSAEQAALAMAQANVANAEALAEAAGAPLSAAQSNYLLIESLYATALSMDENSPVRAALLAHIGTLQSVPPTANTTVTADTTQAQENIGKVLTDAEKLNTETDTKANAETATALEAVQTLQGAVDGLAEGVSIPIDLVGYSITLSQLRTLRTELDLTRDAADRADRAVARVAG